MTGEMRPDGTPWPWDDPDLPVDVFLTMYRRLHPGSRDTDLKLRGRWQAGTRIDSGGHLHHYPGNAKSSAEAMGTVATDPATCPTCGGVGYRGPYSYDTGWNTCVACKGAGRTLEGARSALEGTGSAFVDPAVAWMNAHPREVSLHRGQSIAVHPVFGIVGSGATLAEAYASFQSPTWVNVAEREVLFVAVPDDARDVDAGAKRDADAGAKRGLIRRVDDILELLVELERATNGWRAGGPVRTVHERLVIEATALKKALEAP
jgi:hypothetical protein